MVYTQSSPQVLSGPWDDLMTNITNPPDEILGVQTMDLIGYATVAATALTAFFIAKKMKKKKGRRKKR